MAKHPSHKEKPSEEKYPRGGERADKVLDLISWHIRIADRQGSWAWNQVNGLTLEGFEGILSKISNFETMKWSEILNRNNHPISISDICPAARRRLKEINQDDVDELISLNVNAKKRVWGIRDQNVLKILWWDPNHTVYPSLKKHT